MLVLCNAGGNEDLQACLILSSFPPTRGSSQQARSQSIALRHYGNVEAPVAQPHRDYSVPGFVVGNRLSCSGHQVLWGRLKAPRRPFWKKGYVWFLLGSIPHLTRVRIKRRNISLRAQLG